MMYPCSEDYGKTEQQLVAQYNKEHPVWDWDTYQKSLTHLPYWTWVVRSIAYEEYCFGEAFSAGRFN